MKTIARHEAMRLAAAFDITRPFVLPLSPNYGFDFPVSDQYFVVGTAEGPQTTSVCLAVRGFDLRLSSIDVTFVDSDANVEGDWTFFESHIMEPNRYKASHEKIVYRHAQRIQRAAFRLGFDSSAEKLGHVSQHDKMEWRLSFPPNFWPSHWFEKGKIA